MEMTGGQALARQLVAEGVSDVFGVPGVQLDWATDALADAGPALRYLTPRHEQATSYMADGYARTTGRPGVCMVVPGPGLLNAMAGLATAYACSSPVLCITGQIPSPTIGRGLGMLHEVPNQSGLLDSVTKWHRLVRTPAEVASLVHEAFQQLRSGRPQPVALEIPPDVLQGRADVSLLDAAPGMPPQVPQAQALEQAARALSQAQLPVIWAGGGVRSAAAAAALAAVAERLQAPVVMSDNGRGALPSGHALALPALGGRCLLPHADVVLVVGSRFVDGRGAAVATRAGARLIYLNLERAAMMDPRPSGIALVGDAAAGLQALQQRLAAQGAAMAPSRAGLVAQVRDWCDAQIAEVQPQLGLVQALRAAMPDDGILVNELTQVGYLASVAFPVHAPGTFVTPGYQGTLGYGFATALGAALGHPGRAVVSINGDGGFGWSLQELATAARYRVRLAIVVFVDGAFGNVRRIQQTVFGREIGTSLHNPDFLALARAFGVAAQRAEGPQALQAAVAAAVRADGPTLIEVPVGSMPGPWHLIHAFSKPPRPAPPNPLGDPSA